MLLKICALQCPCQLPKDIVVVSLNQLHCEGVAHGETVQSSQHPLVAPIRPVAAVVPQKSITGSEIAARGVPKGCTWAARCIIDLLDTGRPTTFAVLTSIQFQIRSSDTGRPIIPINSSLLVIIVVVILVM